MTPLLSRLGLRFADDEDERVFAHGFVHGTMLESQAFLVAAAFIVYIFSAWDRIIDPVHWHTTHMLRGLLVSPLLAGAGVALFTPFARRHFEAVIVLASLSCSLGVASIYALLDHGYQYAALGFSLTLFGTTAMFPVRSRYLFIVSVLNVVIVVVGQTWAGNAGPGWLVVNLIAVLSAFCMGTLSAFMRERSARAGFLANKELAKSRQRVDDLLHSMLPKDIVARIQAGETTIADSHSEVSVIFADLVGFTVLSREISPARLVEMLNDLFSAFDLEAERYGIERIKTIGDAYMAVGGLASAPVGTDHAVNAAEFAFAMLRAVQRMVDEQGYDIQVRIGLHIGPVVAGVIGMRHPAFDCWGDSVNLASRLEGRAPAGSILISESACWRLRPLYDVEPEGDVELKGMGLAKVYRLIGRRAEPDTDAAQSKDLADLAWSRI
jgi:class 3 adenylate cyclase